MPIFKAPRILKKELKQFGKCFTRPQLENFSTLVTGLIVSGSKTIQEINDALSEKNQSSLNRFVTGSEFDLKKVNARRLKLVQKVLPSSKHGFIIVDDMLSHKTGEKMEYAGYHRSGVTKRIEWGHCIVDSYYTPLNGTGYPIDADIYIREGDCDESVRFRTKREMFLEQVDTAIRNNVRAKTVIADSGFYADLVVRSLKARSLKHVLGVNTTLKISINREKRISVKEYMNSLTGEDFTSFKVRKKGKKKKEKHFIHEIEVSIRGVGKEKLLISYKKGDEKEVRAYVTDHLEWSKRQCMRALLKRWSIECWHRDAKQHLGLEDYQVRKHRGIQVVVLAVLAAYTLLILSQARSVFSSIKRILGRGLGTVGEACRFMQLAAEKGWNWITRKTKEPSTFKKILNKHVLVKNAKV